MINENILCWIPGIQYTSKGPIWIDMITIKAFLQSKPLELEIPISPTLRLPMGYEVTLYLAKNAFNSSDPTRSLCYTYENTDNIGVLNHKLYHALNGGECPHFTNLNSTNIGLCCALHDGNIGTTIKFIVELYTCMNWKLSDDKEYYFVENTESRYKLIDVLEFEYNPFVLGEYKIPISGIDTDYSSYEEPLISKKLIMDEEGSILLNGDKLLVSSNIETSGKMSIDFSNLYNIPTLTYSELPTVPIIHTDTAKKKSFNSLDNTILAIKKKLDNYDNFKLCVFGPLNDSDLTDSDAAFIGCVSSDNIEVGKLRYSALYIDHGKYDLGASLHASYMINTADLSDLSYFYSNLPLLEISVSVDKPHSSFTQPTSLYTVNNSIVTFSSGCDLKSLWDRVSTVNNKQLLIWPNWDNVITHTGIEEPKLSTIIDTPVIHEESITLSLYNNDLEQITSSITWPSLSNTGFVTFIDTDTNVSNVASKVTNAYNTHFGEFRNYQALINKTISIFEYSAKFLMFANLTTSEQKKTDSEFVIVPYYHFTHFNENKESYSYLVGDSLYGGKVNVSGIEAGIEFLNDSGSKIESTSIGSRSTWLFTDDPVTLNAVCLSPNKRMNIKVTVGNSIPANSYILIKWNQVILYEGGTVKVEASETYPYNMTIAKVNDDHMATVEIKNTSAGNLYINQNVAVFTLQDLSYTSEEDANTFISNNIILPHCFAAYEEVTLFKSGVLQDWGSGLVLLNIYFPPPELYCIGYYKSVGSTQIDAENVTFINSRTPIKNAALLDELIKQPFKYSIV